MKRLSMFLAIALIASTATFAMAADTVPGAAVADMHIYKADLSGAKLPPVATTATGEATFQLLKPGITGGTGGTIDRSATGGTGMSSTGTSIPGDNTGMSGPGQGFGQDQAGADGSYAGIDKSREIPGQTPGSVPGSAPGGAVAGDALRYDLTMKNIKDVTAAHLHMGKRTTSEGPVVAPLYLGPKKAGEFSGTLAQGTITDKDLKGPLAGKTVDDLVALMKSGDIYVNVHTAKHPAGEIRGEVKEVS